MCAVLTMNTAAQREVVSHALMSGVMGGEGSGERGSMFESNQPSRGSESRAALRLAIAVASARV